MQEQDASTESHAAPSMALALRSEITPSPYEPTNLDQARALARDFAGSKLTKCRTEQQALLIMATGRELGIPATTALRMIYVADFGQGDQVALSADLMVALCLRSPLCEYFEAAESTDEKAVYRTKRKGRPERTAAFAIADKERAKLGKVKEGKDESASNWAKYPSVMLRHRAASILAREVFPDVIGGFYTEDEAREMAASVAPASISPLPRSTPAASPRPRGSQVVDAEFTESKGESLDQKSRQWEAELRAATSETAAKSTVDEIKKSLEKDHPVRVALSRVLSERKAANWQVTSEPEREPSHDELTGVVAERQPGDEG